MTAETLTGPAGLRAIEARLSALGEELESLEFFSRCGAPLDSVAAGLARDYLDGLGLGVMRVGAVPSLAEGLALIRRTDTDAAWRTAEAALGANLAAALDAAIGPSRAANLLNEVMRRASEAVTPAAERLAAGADAPEAVKRAAAGAVIQAACETALAGALDEDETHPFAARFDLIRAGRWPLAAAGGVFHLH